MNVKNIFRKTIETLINILLVVICIVMILVIYCTIQIRVFHKDYANLFGYAFFEIGTGSMKDTLNIGDAIIVKLTKNVEINDIIVFEKDNYYITHRVIAKEGDKITSKGDANNIADEQINTSDVCGKVVKVIKKFDIIKKTFFSPVVLLLIIVTLIAIGVFIFYKPPKNSVE